ncbi:hypothetical protein FA95DRAFT_1313680, partial [Auriscalpium vulgare]
LAHGVDARAGRDARAAHRARVARHRPPPDEAPHAPAHVAAFRPPPAPRAAGGPNTGVSSGCWRITICGSAGRVAVGQRAARAARRVGYGLLEGRLAARSEDRERGTWGRVLGVSGRRVLPAHAIRRLDMMW